MKIPGLKFMSLGVVLLSGACVEVEPNNSDTNTPSTGASETDAPSSGGSETGAPDSATGETAADTGSDTGSDTGTATETATDTGIETATATDTGELPAACGEQDPAASAALTLELTGWPEDTTEDLDIDVQCVIDAVDAAGASVATALTCDVGGEPLAALLTIAAAPEGEVAWVAGQAVHLVARNIDESELDLGFNNHVSMRLADDDSLLLAAVRSENLWPQIFAPLTVELALACGPADELDPVPMQISFTAEEGAKLDLISAHRGELVVNEAVRFAIDAQEVSTGNCCHYIDWHEVLLRRVVVDG